MCYFFLFLFNLIAKSVIHNGRWWWPELSHCLWTSALSKMLEGFFSYFCSGWRSCHSPQQPETVSTVHIIPLVQYDMCVRDITEHLSATQPQKHPLGYHGEQNRWKRPADSGLVMINLIASSLIVRFPAETTLENLTRTLRLHCVIVFFSFFFFLSNTNFQFGRTCNNTLNKALISCSYLIIMRTLPDPHVLIIYYTEVSTLLIQKVALAPINWIGMVNIPLGGPVRSGGVLHQEVERDT